MEVPNRTLSATAEASIGDGLCQRRHHEHHAPPPGQSDQRAQWDSRIRRPITITNEAHYFDFDITVPTGNAGEYLGFIAYDRFELRIFQNKYELWDTAGPTLIGQSAATTQGRHNIGLRAGQGWGVWVDGSQLTLTGGSGSMGLIAAPKAKFGTHPNANGNAITLWENLCYLKRLKHAGSPDVESIPLNGEPIVTVSTFEEYNDIVDTVMDENGGRFLIRNNLDEDIDDVDEPMMGTERFLRLRTGRSYTGEVIKASMDGVTYESNGTRVDFSGDGALMPGVYLAIQAGAVGAKAAFARTSPTATMEWPSYGTTTTSCDFAGSNAMHSFPVMQCNSDDINTDVSCNGEGQTVVDSTTGNEVYPASGTQGSKETATPTSPPQKPVEDKPQSNEPLAPTSEPGPKPDKTTAPPPTKTPNPAPSPTKKRNKAVVDYIEHIWDLLRRYGTRGGNEANRKANREWVERRIAEIFGSVWDEEYWQLLDALMEFHAINREGHFHSKRELTDEERLKRWYDHATFTPEERKILQDAEELAEAEAQSAASRALMPGNVVQTPRWMKGLLGQRVQEWANKKDRNGQAIGVFGALLLSTVGDGCGIVNMADGISGVDTLTGEKLSDFERARRGILGGLQFTLASLQVAQYARASNGALGCGGGNCFVAGTLVATSSGSKPIEEICVGDWVLSRDDKTGEQGYKQVEETFIRECDELIHLSIATSPGRSFEIVGTAEHPFWSVSRNTWVEMGELKLGETLRLSNGCTALIDGSRTQRASSGECFIVHNFRVADWHTYFVLAHHAHGWGVWVHNASYVRFGVDSAQKLAAEAAKAKSLGFPHGVSVWKFGKVPAGARSALVEEAEKVFSVVKTGKKAGHYTVVLDEPVTDDVARLFSSIFK